MDFPTKRSEVIMKFVGLIWSSTYAIYWLSAIKFPTKFIYFLPVALIIMNSVTLTLHVNSIINDLDELSPEELNKEIVYCFIS